MKILSILSICLLIIATGCKPGSFFKTPNEVSKMQGIIRFMDGTQKEGLITINFGREHPGERYEWVVLNTAQGEEKFKAQSIEYYKIGEDYYYPKTVELYFDGTMRLLFVKRLTKENARIQMYELFEESRESIDGQGNNYYYFIAPANLLRLEAWNIFGKSLRPDFNYKMSMLVKDCPALADKILTKQKKYDMPQVLGFNAKVEVVKRIVDEYNNCK
ncbi:MAG: hypothetical protein QM726_09145 [Chitinophagaceae bacterium]